MSEDDDDEPMPIPCCMCGLLTTWDPVYNDLCYRCIRADNE
jgi:NMD protein affecting ribosome stability and mRNA decay